MPWKNVRKRFRNAGKKMNVTIAIYTKTSKGAAGARVKEVTFDCKA